MIAVAHTGPIFVVGSMRSGSTMLRLILDSHPHIAIGGETGFMGGLLAAKEIPGWKFGNGWYERLGWSEEEFDARLREFYTGLFHRHATSQGKTRWGDKTPFHTAHMAEMAQVFPDAVFVGLVRHPGAVAASLHRKFHYTFPEALSYWSATNLDLVRGASGLGARFTLCRYEDIVVRGERVLREVLSFLEEPWHPDVLEHHRVQRAKGAPRAAEGGTITSQAVDASRAVQWSEHITAEDRRALASTADLAAFFGYDPLDPSVLSPISEHEQNLTVGGAELAARRSAWSGRIDFERRAIAPAIEARPEELAERLARAETALARARSRRAVRFADAFRKVQRGRSASDVRDAWAMLRQAPERNG